MANHDTYDPWRYYEIDKDVAECSNREISNGAFAVIVIWFIISLFLIGDMIALFVGLFTS